MGRANGQNPPYFAPVHQRLVVAAKTLAVGLRRVRAAMPPTGQSTQNTLLQRCAVRRGFQSCYGEEPETQSLASAYTLLDCRQKGSRLLYSQDALESYRQQGQRRLAPVPKSFDAFQWAFRGDSVRNNREPALLRLALKPSELFLPPKQPHPLIGATPPDRGICSQAESKKLPLVHDRLEDIAFDGLSKRRCKQLSFRPIGSLVGLDYEANQSKALVLIKPE